MMKMPTVMTQRIMEMKFRYLNEIKIMFINNNDNQLQRIHFNVKTFNFSVFIFIEILDREILSEIQIILQQISTGKALFFIRIILISMKNGILAELKRLKQMKAEKQTNLENFLGTNKGSENPKRSHKSLQDQETRSKFQQSAKSSHHQISNIFQGFSFCFPIKDISLTPQIIKYLTKQIISREGKIVQYNEDLKNKKVNFLVCSRKVNLGHLAKKVADKLIYDQVIDVAFIKDCVKKQQFVGIDDYLLFQGMEEKFDIKDVEEEDENNIAMCDSGKIKKKIKTDHHSQNSDKTQKLSDQQQDQQQQLPNQKISHPHIKQNEHEKKQQVLCQLTGKDTGKKPNFQTNNFLVQQLSKLQKIYANQKDFGRKVAYMKAVSIIKNYPDQIRSPEDLNDIKGIGPKLKDKIKELLSTGRLQKLQKLQHTDKNIALNELTRVWSIGPTKAQQLYNQGIKTLEELKLHKNLLNKNQLIGLKYCQQFQQKIPRDKVTKIFNFVKSEIQSLVGQKDLHNIQVCGSYRRNKPFCGDVDIIISRKDGQFEKTLLLDLVVKLQNKSFLTDHLTYPKVATDRSSMSYMGVCLFEGNTHHRIDIKYYPIQEYAFALLYFTGSGQFNRSLRIEARKMNLSLSDHGFKQLQTDKNKQKNKKGGQIDAQCYTEQDIFKFLRLEYKTPEERNI